MKVSKSMLAAGTVTTFAVVSLVGFGAVSAHGSNGNRTNENNEQKMEQRQEKRTEKLQSLVENGTLSEEQRTALEARHAEIHALRDELKNQDLPRQEMRERMQESREEFKKWAQDQGINLDELKPEGGERRGHMSRKNN
jgi:SMC interacting uncharacterized protein involved in chromosome segregation